MNDIEDLMERLLKMPLNDDDGYAVRREAATQLRLLANYREMYKNTLCALQERDAKDGRDDALEWRDEQIKGLKQYLDDDYKTHKQQMAVIGEWLRCIKLRGPSKKSNWETQDYTGLAAFYHDHPEAVDWFPL